MSLFLHWGQYYNKYATHGFSFLQSNQLDYHIQAIFYISEMTFSNFKLLLLKNISSTTYQYQKKIISYILTAFINQTNSQQQQIMKNLCLLLLLFLKSALAGDLYCSATCASNSCTGTTPNMCVNCDAPFTNSNNFCVPPTYYQKQASTVNFALPGVQIYCGSAVFIGTYTWNQHISLNYPGPITTFHTKVILIFGVVLYGSWVTDVDAIKATLNGVTQTFLITSTTTLATSTDCSSATEQYVKAVIEFAHSDTANSVVIDVFLTNTNQKQWAIKDLGLYIQMCHDACQVCSDYTNTTCSLCTAGYKLSGSICDLNCLNGYGETSDPLVCVLCDTKCTACQQISTNCSSCISSAYLLSNSCLDACPDGYFEYQSDNTCLDCATYCTTASLVISAESDDIMVCNICFSQSMDFNSFPFESFTEISFNDSSLDLLTDFSVVYTAIDSSCYSIEITANALTELQDFQLLIQVNPQPANGYYSTNQMKLSPDIYTLNDTITWNLARQTIAPQNQTQFYSTMVTIITDINQKLSGMGVQEIRKAGLYSLFLPGIQLSSTLVMQDDIPPQNMYEAMRFWGLFVYLQVPEWGENPSIQQYIFNQNVSSLLNTFTDTRLLQTSTIDTLKFERTGYSTYFIFDCYFPIIMIVICWIIIGITKCFRMKIGLSIRSGLFIFVHKIHEICAFYLVMSSLLQWIIFDVSSNWRIFSIVASIIMAFYFLLYYLYIFYRLIPFGSLDICSFQYIDYVEQFAYFLRDIRHTITDEQQVEQWQFSHFFRPYNFQLLGIYRLILFVCALPLFQGQIHACVLCLLSIQFLQLLRLIIIRPFHSRWRNIFKILIQIQLFASIAILTAESFLYQSIATGDASIEDIYDILGWIGFSLLFSYNISYFVYFVVDLICGCLYSNKERIQFSTKVYYTQFLEQTYITPKKQPSNPYEQRQIRSLLTKGNIFEHENQQKYKTIDKKIEQFKIIEESPQLYRIKSFKINQLFYDLHPKPSQRDNVSVFASSTHTVTLSPSDNPQYFQIFSNIFQEYAADHENRAIILQTFLKINQNRYEAGQKIMLQKCHMFQEIFVITEKGVFKDRLSGVLSGFPIPPKLIDENQQRFLRLKQQQEEEEQKKRSSFVNFKSIWVSKQVSPERSDN